MTEDHWTQSIAVGNAPSVIQASKALAHKGKHRNIVEVGNSFCIKENYCPYNAHFATEMDLPRPKNTVK